MGSRDPLQGYSLLDEGECLVMAGEKVPQRSSHFSGVDQERVIFFGLGCVGLCGTARVAQNACSLNYIFIFFPCSDLCDSMFGTDPLVGSKIQ
jgi:hypothetical protein